MGLSLIQAASQTGRSKSTIHRAIKSGKLSAHRNDDGSYSIDPAELFRAYPKEPNKSVPMRQSGTTPELQEDTAQDSAILQLKVEMLNAQLEREQETVADLRKRLDKAEDRLLALSAPTQNYASARGFWARLLGIK